MPQPWTRPLSPLERAWLVADGLYGPFVNQMVVQGQGTLDVRQWRQAVAVAAVHAPGARVAIRGVMCKSRWQALDVAPPVREVDGSAWDGRSEVGAPFLRDPLDPFTGPTTEVVLVQGPEPRVIFRTAHAAMDGGGTIGFAKEVFRVLRGEDPRPLTDPVTDLELALRLGSSRAPAPVHDALSPAGMPQRELSGVTWRRVTVQGSARGLLGKVAVALAGHARALADGEGAVRFDVPADLRRTFSDARSTANLTGMLSVTVEPGSSPADVDKAVRAALDSDQAGRSLRGLGVLRHLPLWLMRMASERGAADHHTRGRYGATGVLSNLGRMDTDALACADFRARSVFWIPPGTEVTALFAALSGSADGIDIVVTMPRMLASDGRIEAVVEAMAAALRA